MTAHDDFARRVKQFIENHEHRMRLILWAHDRCSDGVHAFRAPKSAEDYVVQAVTEVIAGRHRQYRKGRSLFRFLCLVIAILIEDEAEKAVDPN